MVCVCVYIYIYIYIYWFAIFWRRAPRRSRIANSLALPHNNNEPYGNYDDALDLASNNMTKTHELHDKSIDNMYGQTQLY